MKPRLTDTTATALDKFFIEVFAKKILGRGHEVKWPKQVIRMNRKSKQTA